MSIHYPTKVKLLCSQEPKQIFLAVCHKFYRAKAYALSSDAEEYTF